MAEAVVWIGDGALDEGFDVVFAEGGELENLRATDERGVDGEERILRRRADEEDLPVLDIGQKDVLLGAVEAVNLIEEEHRALAMQAEALFGVVDDFANFLDADSRGVELLEVRFAVVCNQRGERGFAGAGRAVEDHTGKPIGLEHAAQELARAEKMLLAGKFVERA